MSKTDEFCCEPLLLSRYEVEVLGLFPKTGTLIGNLSERTLKSEQLYLGFGVRTVPGTASISIAGPFSFFAIPLVVP